MLIKGDCLIESDRIESSSVDLILTDLPFGTMKGRDYSKQPNQKEGSKTSNDHYWDEVIPTEKIMSIANRILRKNGKMILFAQDPFTTELKNKSTSNIQYNYNMIWEKSNFANCLLINKACVNYYEDILLFTSKSVDENDEIRKYLINEKNKSGLTNKQFNNLFSKYTNKKGNRDRSVLEHYWGKSQHEIPTEDIYKNVLQPTGFFNVDYTTLLTKYNKHKSTFNLWEGKKYKSNIFKYSRSDVGLHPTQKPVLLLEDLIKTFSNKGDNIVDLTMGSGSTGVACVNTNRKFIGIELDKNYYEIAKKRIKEAKVKKKRQIF